MDNDVRGDTCATWTVSADWIHILAERSRRRPDRFTGRRSVSDAVTPEP